MVSVWAREAYVRVAVELKAFLTSTSDGGKRSTSRPSQFFSLVSTALLGLVILLGDPRSHSDTTQSV
jgi:hypothetical protein